MPIIKQLKTISMAQPVDAEDQTPDLPAEKQSAFYSLVESFLLLNPTPTDEHIHMLATCVGMDPETFEQLMYKMFGDALSGEESEGLLTEDDGEPLVDEGNHSALMARLLASNVDDNTVNKNLFDVNDIEPIEAADADGNAAENDGVVDTELVGGEDPMKKASEGDGAVDEELVQENMGGGL